MKRVLAVLALFIISPLVYAQEPGLLNKVGSRVRSIGGGGQGGGADTIGFVHRDDRKDSISITFKYLDSIRSNTFDSSINDFDRYFPVPASWQYLGNNGAAAYPLIYTPNLKPGWDAGFHAYDVYRFTLEESKFYKTNRPFTQLSYQLASGKEQMIKAFHTQNPRPNWNFGFDYRLVSAPGFYVTQNSNHKSYRLFSNYQGKRKRYAAYLVLVGNTLKKSENGGIKYDSLLLDPNYKKRYSIPVNLGNASLYEPNPFLSSVTTGNIYKDFTFFFRHSYDLGKRDSVAINDSTTEYLFYPKLRIQHSFTYSSYDYFFKDEKADSAIYKTWYDTTLKAPIDTFYAREKWSVIRNDFSLLQFPDTKNPGQFLLVGATLENIKGTLKGGRTHNYHNLVIHGEYRNKTRNKLWDVLAKGVFYANGLNAGDYSAQVSIARQLNKKLGGVRIFFSNVNRTPSFVYDNGSSFNLTNHSITKKENIISFGAEASGPFISLGFKNHLINNLAYFTDYYHTAQSGRLINLMQFSAAKKFSLTKRWKWYFDATVQVVDGSAPIKVPLVYTRNRLAYEGLFYKNLNLSTGIELRYHTPFEAYNFSPLAGQFMPQDTVTIKNLPDIAAFFHFRIKSFTAFLRAENLNSVQFTNGFGFTNNNFAALHYPMQGFIFRFGIRWGFVN